tara:strand:- start:1282 stop:2019 length:738 start_codon:yes stop_codon:yes gene_type:complete
VLDFYFYFTASIGVILFGISKGGFAGPASILAIPIMCLSMSPITAAGILLPILLIMDFIALYFYWEKWDLRNIKIIIPPAIIGIFVGGLTFEFISADIIRIIVGIICVMFIILSIYQKSNFIFNPSVNKGRIWSLISGYTSCIIHAGGQPLSIYLLPQKLNKTLYVGTMTLSFLVVNLIKLIPYYFLDLLIITNLKISLILSPLAPISILFGYYLHKKFNDEIFFSIIYFLLAISGLKLIYDGIF